MKNEILGITLHDHQKIASHYEGEEFDFFAQDLNEVNKKDAQDSLNQYELVALVSKPHGGIIGYINKEYAGEIAASLNLQFIAKQSEGINSDTNQKDINNSNVLKTANSLSYRVDTLYCGNVLDSIDGLRESYSFFGREVEAALPKFEEEVRNALTNIKQRMSPHFDADSEYYSSFGVESLSYFRNNKMIIRLV